MANPTIKEVKEWMMTLYTESQNQITPAERTEQYKYATMVKNPSDKQFLVKMLKIFQKAMLFSLQKMTSLVKDYRSIILNEL